RGGGRRGAGRADSSGTRDRAGGERIRAADRHRSAGRAARAMKIEIVTLFPRMVEAPVAESIVGRARSRGLVNITVHDLRAFAEGRHQITDEPPFGGGGGMILKPEPVAAALDAVKTSGARVNLLDPAGPRVTRSPPRGRRAPAARPPTR